MTVHLYAPDGNIGPNQVELSALPSLMKDQRVAALDNGKPGADRLLARIGERIASRTGARFVGVVQKGSAATPCEEEFFQELLETADVLLTGTAD